MPLRSITSHETDALRNMAVLLREETYKRRNDSGFDLGLAKIDMDVLLYLIRMSVEGKLMLNDRKVKRFVEPEQPQKSEKRPSDFGLAVAKSVGVVGDIKEAA